MPGRAGAQHPIDSPRLPSDLSREPARQCRGEWQWETEENQPEQEPALFDPAGGAQTGSDPGKRQHDQTASDHEPECEERDQHRRAVLRREVRQSDLLGIEAHAPDQAAEDRDLDLVTVGLGGRIGDGEQDLSGGLLVVPAPLDGRELGGLVVVHVVAGEMPEKDLDRHQHGSEVQAHAQHDVRFGSEDPAEQVPGTGRGNAETAGDKRRKQHVREAHPDHRHLHPAVVDHDPEGREIGAQPDHRGRKQVEPWSDTRTPEQQDPEKAGLEKERGEGLVSEQRSLDRSRHARQFAPVGPELEAHHNTGDDAETERHPEDLEPELEDQTIDWPAGREMQRFEHGQPGRQPDREGRKDDVERHGECELNSGQEKRREVQRTLSRQRHRFERARSISSSPRPLITVFIMYSVKPFAISKVIAGGMASSVRFTTASIKTGPSWASASAIPASTSPGSSSLIPRTPTAAAIAAKFGFLNPVPKSRKPVDFCSTSTNPRAPLLNTTTFTGRASCTRLRKSPISIANPPSPDSEITCRAGNAA